MFPLVKAACRLVGLTRYLLPCKNPEESDDNQEMELLPREVPSYLELRIFALLIVSWIVCLVSILSLSIGPFITGLQLIEMLKLPLV